MSKNYTVMELEAIKHLCKCVNSVASLPTDLIADTNVATNTTYSSYRIDAEMSALETDIQAYVDTALAGLSRLTKEVIDDKTLVVKENVLYLYKDPSDMNNDYMQMMLINGVVIELGNSVYSKDEIDDKFALKTDMDKVALKHEYFDKKVTLTDSNWKYETITFKKYYNNTPSVNVSCGDYLNVMFHSYWGCEAYIVNINNKGCIIRYRSSKASESEPLEVSIITFVNGI